MKSIITFLILGFNGFLAAGQCCPYINSITVDPANPSSTDNIRIFTSITTPNQGAFIQHSFTVQNDTIFAEACYWEGTATALQTFYDTIEVGELAEGDYVLQFTAKQSSVTGDCVVNSSQVYYTDVAVDESADIPEYDQTAILLYPNPVNGMLQISLAGEYEGKTIETVRLRNPEGKLIVLTEANALVTSMDLGGLSGGCYFVEITTNDQLFRKMVMKE